MGAMSVAWIIPAVIALVGGAVVAGLARRVVEELHGLRRDAMRFSDLRPALVEVRELLTRRDRG
jgi:cytochrome c-type biogenesis protein CcmH/NrfF